MSMEVEPLGKVILSDTKLDCTLLAAHGPEIEFAIAPFPSIQSLHCLQLVESQKLHFFAYHEVAMHFFPQECHILHKKVFPISY